MEPIKGGCLCGAVRFEVLRAPYRVGLCHCLDCRKHHGALFRTFAILPSDGLRVTGETRSYDHQGKGRRHFCPICGSPLYSEDGVDEIELFVGALDETNQLQPTYELWTTRRESWLPAFPLARSYSHDRAGSGRPEP